MFQALRPAQMDRSLNLFFSSGSRVSPAAAGFFVAQRQVHAACSGIRIFSLLEFLPQRENFFRVQDKLVIAEEFLDCRAVDFHLRAADA